MPSYEIYIIFFLSRPWFHPIIRVSPVDRYFLKLHTDIHFKGIIQKRRESTMEDKYGEQIENNYISENKL